MSRRGAARALAMLGICALMLVTAGPSPLAAQQADPPAKPTGLTGTIAHDRVTLTWDDPGDDSITGYQIRRRHASVNNRDDFQTHVDNTGTNATTYVDTDVVSGEALRLPRQGPERQRAQRPQRLLQRPRAAPAPGDRLLRAGGVLRRRGGGRRGRRAPRRRPAAQGDGPD